MSIPALTRRLNGAHFKRPKRSSFLAAVCSSIVAIGALSTGSLAIAADKGKVLVILSSADELTLRDGKKYHTGFYVDELEVPVRKMVDAGFTPVFANPNGNAANFDPLSNDKIFFGGDDDRRADAVKYLDHFPEIKHPKTFATILKEGTSDYVGIFIPGGHAPMQDLIQDRKLGDILVSFHDTGRPTAVICHGPTALLSTITDPVAYYKAMAVGDIVGAQKLANGWPYAGYRITVFTAAEERLLEGAGNQLGGTVLFYAPDALAQAGAHVDRLAAFAPNVVEDRELVSGQQPFSSEGVGEAFVKKLEASKS